MEIDLKHTLVPITLFLLIFGVVYLFLNTRYRERMALIERGLDPRSDLDTISFRQRSLRYGLLGVGVGLGLLGAEFLYQAGWVDNSIGYPALALVGGGLSLLIYYRASRDNNEA